MPFNGPFVLYILKSICGLIFEYAQVPVLWLLVAVMVAVVVGLLPVLATRGLRGIAVSPAGAGYTGHPYYQ